MVGECWGDEIISLEADKPRSSLVSIGRKNVSLGVRGNCGTLVVETGEGVEGKSVVDISEGVEGKSVVDISEGVEGAKSD